MLANRLSTLLCIAAATTLAGPAPAVAEEVPDLGNATAEARALPDTWFVQLRSAPAADGTRSAALEAEQQAFRAAAAKAGAKFTERLAFGTLWNGLSITASRSDINKIKSLSGVTGVWPVAILEAPSTESGSAPDLFSALTMTGANLAQSELGYTGEGIKVAVMDTGIDIDHPDFGGSGTNGATSFPTARVTHGYDFVGDAYNADPSSAAYNPVPTPDPNPDDCGGHGTHVAGIVGANGTVTGVAPDVTFGAYRVFGCDGSTTADIMIAAMERALADGMQVLNMSIGSSFQWPQYPTATAANRLVNKGMVVVASIGNSGTSGLYAAGAPGLGQKVIGVASFDNTVVTQPAFTINPGNLLVGYNLATGAPPPPATGTYPIAAPANVEGCNAADYAGFPAGHIALVRRGSCTFHVKALNAMNAGASAAVLYNNAAGALNPTVVGVPAITIPVVAITLADGTAIAATVNATLTWGDSIVTRPNATGGLISSFSSYGLAPDLTLKPDIGAPGGSIYSTYPLERGRYTTISGTSMASPHVAGAAALMLQARPRTNSQVMRTLLQNSADPAVWWGNPGLGFLDNVHRQGAGMLDIDDAILATTKVEPGKIAAGEGQAGPYTETLRIENNGPSAVTYDLSFVNALSTGGVITATFASSDASVTFSAPSVTVPAGGAATVDATITPATAPLYGQYGGYIVLTDAADADKVFRVPFAGFVGDYQGIQVLVPTASGFPLVGRATSCVRVIGFECINGTYAVPQAPATFTMTDALNVPSLLVHFDHQSRLFRVEIFDQNGKPWHRAYNDDYMPRNSSPTGFFAFPLDGTTFAGNKTYTLPDGTYYAKVSVLKALGDSENPAHWETRTTAMFVIDRP